MAYRLLSAEINIGSGARGLSARRTVRNQVDELLVHRHAPIQSSRRGAGTRART